MLEFIRFLRRRTGGCSDFQRRNQGQVNEKKRKRKF